MEYLGANLVENRSARVAVPDFPEHHSGYSMDQDLARLGLGDTAILEPVHP